MADHAHPSSAARPTRSPRSAADERRPFTIGQLQVRPGTEATGEIEVPRLVTGTRLSLPLRIVHGRDSGPVVFVSSSIHGDEILGVEIIRRVAADLSPDTLHGTVVFVPIVNVHGFATGDRYLPDRRDLNRSFPGSPRGSLASRIAHVFLHEVVAGCDVGIDLHTGSDDRINLAQVRGDLSDETTLSLADAFAPPVVLDARVRRGSLRGAAADVGTTVLLYEAGEANRFDPTAIEVGVVGIQRVLHHLDMLAGEPPTPIAVLTDQTMAPLRSTSSSWVRARRSGITTLEAPLGTRVTRGQQIGVIHDSLGRQVSRVRAPFDGLVIGHTQHPLAHQGDAVVHLARIQVHDGPAPPATAHDPRKRP